MNTTAVRDIPYCIIAAAYSKAAAIIFTSLKSAPNSYKMNNIAFNFYYGKNIQYILIHGIDSADLFCRRTFVCAQKHK
jgi:hypothetical protein